jgi:hypothetical protein
MGEPQQRHNRRSYVTIVSKLLAMGDLLDEIERSAEVDQAARRLLARTIEDLIDLTTEHVASCGTLWGPEMIQEEAREQTQYVRTLLLDIQEAILNLAPGESTREGTWRMLRRTYGACREVFDARARDLRNAVTVL